MYSYAPPTHTQGTVRYAHRTQAQDTVHLMVAHFAYSTGSHPSHGTCMSRTHAGGSQRVVVWTEERPILHPGRARRCLLRHAVQRMGTRVRRDQLRVITKGHGNQEGRVDTSCVWYS